MKQTTSIIVRGQIDLWFEEAGELVIVDYKTDRDESGGDGYALQLRLYALALERYAGRRPNRAVLYYLRSNRIVEISLTRCRLGRRARCCSGVKTGAGSVTVSVESWGAVQEVLILGRTL